MALMGVPAALSNRLWARLRARKEGASFIVVSKSCRCACVRGCTYLTIITSSGCPKGAMQNGSALMRYKIGIVSKNFWSSTYLLALDPIAETLGDPNSYGFRKERAPADAMEQCFNVLARRHAPQWILEGDIRACFDAFSHAWLGAHMPLERAILQKWLKAGCMDKQVLSPTEMGVPQGGICSPVIANL